VSLDRTPRQDFDEAACIACEVIRAIMEEKPPRGALINMNIPSLSRADIKGTAVTAQSTVSYEDDFELRTDPRGGRYYWMTGEMPKGVRPDSSDVHLLADGFITLTPLQSNLTNRALLAEAGDWKLDIDL
jgi:5'-nucleotidase